ncbi:MAG TPA: hypothetical protein VLV16_03800 [Gemmatimonadales bacterium]|nr:hypothetical protein [Gemmatimonadales bacterium]
MLSKAQLTKSGAAIALVLLAVAGCRQGPPVGSQGTPEEVSKMSTERDQLLAEVAENARMMSEIGADLARVRIPSRALKVSSESPVRAQRDSIIARIHYVTTRVNESERKLKESEDRIHALTTLSDSLRSSLEASVQNYESVLEAQRATIAALTDQINQLTADNVALTDTVTQLKTINNTVYYVIGTRDELLKKGIVVQEGGSRFPLIFAKVGVTVVPARQLDPAAFTPINKRAVTEIPLPSSDHAYRIASRQDLDGLVTAADGGKINGTLKIANPDKFWSTSRFLILIES